MDALITDFDGVVADSEPLHLQGFAAVLAREGVTFTHEDYYGSYLGLDDHDCFLAAGRDSGIEFSQETIARMIASKTRMMQSMMAESIKPIDGIVPLLTSLARARIPMAVCTGALRNEVEICARAIGVRQHFLAIVTAEDVSKGKPDPQGYAKALDQLREITGRPLQARRCVVTEDAPAGIAAAKLAGMKVLAITSSYPPEAIRQADLIVDSFKSVTLADLQQLTHA